MHKACQPISEETTLAEIGPCFIRGLPLRERNAMLNKLGKRKTIYDPVLSMMEVMIVDKGGDRIWNVKNWDIWAGKHTEEATKLIETVQRVFGVGGEKAKKS